MSQVIESSVLVQLVKYEQLGARELRLDVAVRHAVAGRKRRDRETRDSRP